MVLLGSFVKSENYSVAGCVRLNAKPMFKLGVKAPIVTILYAVETTRVESAAALASSRPDIHVELRVALTSS